MTVTAPAPGVYTPSPTFFKASGAPGRQELDIETQVNHTIYLAENGIKGVVLLGSTGEMIHLTREERVALVAGTKKGLQAKGHGDFPILAGVAHHGVQDTIDEIKAMKEAGAVYAMALAPNYFAAKNTQQGLISWFVAVADEAVIPIVIYYFPGVSNGLRMTPETIAKLSAHPNIVGIKQSHGDVSDYAQIGLNPEVQKNDFAVMTGLGQLLLPAITVGITGTIDAMSGAYPKLLVKLYQLSVAGKIKEAQALQYVVARCEELVNTHGPVGSKHMVARVLGLSSEAELGRAPLNVALTSAQKDSFEAALREADALEKSL
jgi:2-keto-3-deoxy-L-rhamnonate aldolase